MRVIVLMKRNLNGVMLYRSLIPHAYMARDENIHIHFTDNIVLMKDEELEAYDILHMTAEMWSDYDVERVQKIGLKVVVDVDDYWRVDRFHELYDYFKEHDRAAAITGIIKKADGVTTSTELLAERIKKFNSNVIVLPNSLMEDDYIRQKDPKSVLMAWIGGNNHTADMFIIQHLQKAHKIPVYIPEMYRQVFKDRFLYYAPQQIPNYLGLYNEYDIILAPLRNNKFNQYKSPLKLVEAGMFKKPIIVSDVAPFSQYLKHKENCLVVRKKTEWAKWSKLLLNDPDLRKHLGENLFKDMVKHFNISEINKKRMKYYASFFESV